jgi:hypothetical protein
LKAAFLALGPIGFLVVAVVFSLASTAAGAEARRVSRIDSAIFVHGSRCADIRGGTADELARGALPAPASRAGATRESQEEIVGALTATAAQRERVEVATSPISHVESHEFFTGREPAASEIAPALSPWISASRRASIFARDADAARDPPARAGIASIEVLPLGSASAAGSVNARGARATGRRVSSVPLDDYG